MSWIRNTAVCTGGSGNGVAKSVAYENEEAAAGDALLQVLRLFSLTRIAQELISFLDMSGFKLGLC
jgi:hypothetical protein